jgi:hypothetical protein
MGIDRARGIPGQEGKPIRRRLSDAGELEPAKPIDLEDYTQALPQTRYQKIGRPSKTPKTDQRREEQRQQPEWQERLWSDRGWTQHG